MFFHHVRCKNISFDLQQMCEDFVLTCFMVLYCYGTTQMFRGFCVGPSAFFYLIPEVIDLPVHLTPNVTVFFVLSCSCPLRLSQQMIALTKTISTGGFFLNLQFRVSVPLYCCLLIGQ